VIDIIFQAHPPVALTNGTGITCPHNPVPEESYSSRFPGSGIG